MTDKDDDILFYVISPDPFDESENKKPAIVGRTKEEVEEEWKKQGGNPDLVVWMEG